MSAADGHAHEIIIVRHSGGDHDDGHHGGAWKIAFADFMTAMMCFFLVMWLINAANEQTKAAVASYFNPVKLIDRNSSRKGLEEVGEGPNAVDKSTEAAEEIGGPSGDDGTAKANNTEHASAPEQAEADQRPDAQLFADPYAVLAEIAADTSTRQNVSDKGDGGAQAAGPASGADGGESYRDPFAPDFWSQQVETNAEQTEDPLEADTRSSDAPKTSAASDPAAETEPNIQEAQQQPTKVAKAEAAKIKAQLAEALGKEVLEDGISVTATEKGVSISVTEELDFGMFEIGSAVPRPELVRAMEKIGRVLAEHKGDIIVNGHTDARPFRNASYDNWRLSSARAQSAYYMITRSGLDERRVVEIAGYADRKLKNPADPMAPENRRIEIFLETGG